MEYTEETIKSRGNPVFRQELVSLTPKCDTKCSLICNFIIIAVFLTFGIFIVILAKERIEYVHDYTKW